MQTLKNSIKKLIINALTCSTLRENLLSVWKRILCDGIRYLSAIVSAFMNIKTRQIVAISHDCHQDTPGPGRYNGSHHSKIRGKSWTFSLQLVKFCFLRSLSPDLQLPPHLSKMPFLRETLNLSPASLLPLNWEKLREALHRKRSGILSQLARSPPVNWKPEWKVTYASIWECTT